MSDQAARELALKRRAAGLCAAFLFAALVPAVIVGIVGQSVRLLVLAFIVTAGHTLLLGLPAFVLAHRKRWISTPTYVVGAFVIGAVPVGLLMWPLHPSDESNFWNDGTALVVNGVPTVAGWLSYASFVGFFGLFGALGGLVFWFVLRMAGALPQLSGLSAKP